MVFSSLIFLFLFLPFVLALYVIATHGRIRNVVLVVASLFFYAWGETWYVFIMLASIAANYLFGLWVGRARGRPSNRTALVCAVAFNLGLLGVFKYAGFLFDNLDWLLAVVGLPTVRMGQVHLPIGISFFTFQAMSYVIDVYRGEARAQRDPVNVALYISLFPQLIAGPIVRYRDIAEQIVSRVMSREGFASGARRFTIGLGKKVLIANVVARCADAVFAIPNGQLTPGLVWLGVICYTLQIYFDFSGYSDMAIGLGRMFGFRFLENFNYPYVSRSIREFWKRWHISLSSWFRDYLYIPLGGSRRSARRTQLNLLTVFLLCGLWHGASWTFAIWGLYHGAFLVAERTRFGGWMDSRFTPLKHAYTLGVVLVGWVIFRAETASQALAFLAGMVGVAQGTGIEHRVAMHLDAELVAAMAVGIVFAPPVLPWLSGLRERLVASRRGAVFIVTEGLLCGGEVLGLLAMLLAAASWLAAGTYNPFIYFRF